jgi:hypothetical protein
MFKKNKYKIFYICTPLVIISFFINFYVASKGVFPVDTFIHYDFSYRILLGDKPVTDYWIVHGFIIDYIQAFFFMIFGNNWNSYLIHSSIFNVIIVLSSYAVFRLLKIETYIAFLISISIAFLAYPVSGTPFLDLHSTFFSLLAIYILIFGIVNNKPLYWFWVSVLLCLAFFSKQVPAFYTIVGVMLLNIYFIAIKKKIEDFIYFSCGAIFFIIILALFLAAQEISIGDFILQIFIFPPSIGVDRYENYDLNFKNIILNYKFIYLVFIPIVIINCINLVKIKNYFLTNDFKIFLVLFVFISSNLFHQIYTKNQVYIFSLIPILIGFLLYYKKFIKYKILNYETYFLLLFCFFITVKYHVRYNIERKFHELSEVQISNAIDAKIINKKFFNLKWISPNFKTPSEEVDIIKDFFNILKKDKQKKMLISEYNFYSSLLKENLHTPSRTFDLISYPRINSKYYMKYKVHLKNIIRKNKIEKIYIFEPFTKYDKNELIFNYISKDCFNINLDNKNFVILKVLNCNELRS